jgi:hypothetical protein
MPYCVVASLPTPLSRCSCYIVTLIHLTGSEVQSHQCQQEAHKVRARGAAGAGYVSYKEGYVGRRDPSGCAATCSRCAAGQAPLSPDESQNLSWD